MSRLKSAALLAASATVALWFTPVQAALKFSVPSASTAPLRLLRTIPLPEVSGRIDHLAVDVKGHRLFLAALEKNSVEVVDLRRQLALQCQKIAGISQQPETSHNNTRNYDT